MEGKQLVFIVPRECNRMKADTFLKKHCKVSSRMIARLKREKDGIIRDGKILRTIDTVYRGDRILLNLPVDKSSIAPVKGDLNILYEDKYIIAVDKPPDMPVHPTKIYQQNTMANYLRYMLLKKNESCTVRTINRLDKDTSGVVVVAKDWYTASHLFRTLNKIYIAVCEGILTGSGTIDKPIRLLEGHTIQRSAGDSGARSVTHYRVINNYDNLSLLELRLETGHTHQIRCHLSSIGHPLAGDDMYGGSLNIIKRQALHCSQVSFVHPFSGEIVNISSPLPEDIKAVLQR